MQKTKLQVYFPMLKTREEIRKTIDERESLAGMFYAWEKKQQNEFLDFCSGARGVKMLYDVFAKAILDPEKYPERLNDILSLLLNKKVTIIKVLPNEGIRIAAEKSLLVMDIVVKLEDGSIANVEIQKIGYAFPGQRCACYSSDLLLRQYKSTREALDSKKLFSYRDMRNVYTIVFLEKSGPLFEMYPDDHLHYFEQESNTGLKLELLQKYIFVPIDIYLKNKENKDISNRLNAWLLFLGSDDPGDIIRLIERYPDFKAMYQQIYRICQNVEDMMGLFSEELAKMDENTVKYMMDEMQEEIDRKMAELAELESNLAKKDEDLAKKDEDLAKKDEDLAKKDRDLAQKDEALAKKDADLAKKDADLAKKDADLQEALRRIAELEAEKQHQ
ncbi:MAG: PD-(D/E)XK nuclease family transposase [Lachnospiraceae bacterium]|nr:PD-(D/E)XK nuclease family transposase [Lachnospiraceae bacterium]